MENTNQVNQVNYTLLENQIKKALSKLNEVSFLSEHAVRQKKRISDFHNDIVNVIKSNLPKEIVESDDFEIISETLTNKIKLNDGYGESIDCDILIKMFGVVVYSIFVKAPITNINKNRHNSGNNVYGEAGRVLNASLLDDKAKKSMTYVSLSFVAENSYIKTQGHIIKSVEKNNFFPEYSIENNVYSYGYVGKNSRIITVKYKLSYDIVSKRYEGKCASMISQLIRKDKDPVVSIDVRKLQTLILDIQNKFFNKKENKEKGIVWDEVDMDNNLLLALTKNDSMRSEITQLFLNKGTTGVPSLDSFFNDYFNKN